MEFIKYQVTEHSCEYILLNHDSEGYFNALIVSISDTGSYEIRNSIWFGDNKDEQPSSVGEFMRAYLKAKYVLEKFLHVY